MHLHQLKIKNLASLRGEHTVEFDNLAGQDLFAITGETGAGKSTLLNALSLALYGKLYKRQLIQSDLVTLGEREASIALQFSVRGVHYLATWGTAVRKKDGSLLGNPRTERFFYQLPSDGNVQESRVLDKSPEEILQLDFEQFSKCVVLNQGEFARFLTASFTERRDILERLYPSDNIDSIGGLAKRKFEESKGLVNNLEIQAHALKEESLFDVAVVQTEEIRHKENIKKIESSLAKLRPVTTILGNLLNQTKLFENAQKSRQLAEAQLQTATAANNTAMSAWQTHHEKLNQLIGLWDKERPTVELHLKEAQELQVWQAEEKNLKTQLDESQKRQQQWNLRAKTLSERLLTLGESLVVLGQQVQTVPLDRPWEKADIRAGSELLRRDELYRQQLEQAGSQLKQTETEGKALNEKLTTLQTSMNAEKQALPTEWQSFTAESRGKALQTLRSQQTERALLTTSLTKADQALKELKPIIKDLKRKSADSSWVTSLMQLREQLLVKHPEGPSHCPLCEQNLGTTLWHKLTSDWDQARASAHQQAAHTATHELQMLVAKESSLEQQMLEHQERLNALPPLAELSSIEEAHVRLIRAEEALRETTARVDTCRTRWKNEQEKHQRLVSEQVPLASAISQWLQQTSTTLGTTLQLTTSQISVLQADAELFRQSKELIREQAGIQTQIDQLTTDLKELTPVIQIQREKCAQMEKNIQSRSLNLQQLYPNTTPAEIFRERNEEIKNLTQKDQWLQNEFRQKERDLGDVRARLNASADQLKQLELLHTQDCEKLAAFLPTPMTVKIEEANILLVPLAQENEVQLQKAQEELKFNTEKLAELRTLLEKDRQLRDKRTLIKQQQDKLDLEVSRYKRLMDVLGQDDLRTYVLSLVEAALIQQTNTELQKLCGGRYEIQHNIRKGKLAPEFWVIDRWRDGLLRKVTTLSGGETFMVSLAMALALAEMTRGKADIDCFFIDEGFGTLDEDSLEGVLEMLQQVQSRGKQIGLITHVKSLSNRLPLNLHLQKDPRGNSTVSVVWN